MILPGSYANGFAPRDGQPLYPELWRGCVGAWNPGLGPSGLTLRDWSGFGNHGTLTNMSAGDDWVLSQGRYALDFDGSNDYVALPDVFFAGGSARSISGWINKPDNTDYGHLFSTGPLNALEYFSFIVIGAGGYAGNSNRQLAIELYTATAWSSETISLNQWTHCCVTYSGGTLSTGLRIYINGRRATNVFAPGPSATVTPNTQPSNTSIGARPTPSAAYSKAMFDDFMYYNRELSPHEVRQLAVRPGIAYELAPRKRSRISLAGFQPYWLARKTQIIGGGV